GEEAHHTVAAFERANHGSGHFFFRQALGQLSLIADLDEDVGQRTLHAGCNRLGALLVHVLILHVDLGRKTLVAIEQVFPIGKSIGAIPINDRKIALYVLYDLGGLIGERVFLVGGGVKAFVVAVRQEIQDAQNRNDDQG